MSLPFDNRTGIRAEVIALSSMSPPWTCEVRIDGHERQETIWYRGYVVGQVIRVERRSSGTAQFWADVEHQDGSTWTE